MHCKMATRASQLKGSWEVEEGVGLWDVDEADIVVIDIELWILKM
jgi:hypothetical protein